MFKKNHDVWQEWWEHPQEPCQLYQVLLPAVHQWVSITAWAAGELLQIWWCDRVKDFDPCHHDSPSVWFTVHTVPWAAWLQYIFAPKILPTFTKAFLKCSYQASLFTLLILLYLHFQPQIGIHGMHNPPPEREARRRPWRLDVTAGLLPGCCFCFPKGRPGAVPLFGGVKPQGATWHKLRQELIWVAKMHNSSMPFCFLLEYSLLKKLCATALLLVLWKKNQSFSRKSSSWLLLPSVEITRRSCIRNSFSLEKTS